MAKAVTSPVVIDIYSLGDIGVVLDVAGHLLPPEAWTGSNNVRFQEGNAAKFLGHEVAFGTPTVAPSFVLNVPAQSQSYWLYPSLTKCYVYEGGVHTNITRQTASVDVNYTAAAHRDWNGCIFGGTPILNNGADIPQYWAAISAGQKLANLTNWPSTMRAKVVRAFGRYLVALNINDNGTLRPQMMWWSHRADPGQVPSSWDYTSATVDAGRKELIDIEGGDILDGVLLGNYLVVYKETSTHIVSWIGGQEIFGSDLILPTTGLLTARCAASYGNGKGHFVVTADNFIVHSGQRNSAEALFDARARKAIFKEIDQTNYRNSFCFTNPAENEVWFCYPEAGQTYPSKALIWNWQFNTTQFRTFLGMWAVGGALQTTDSETWASATGSWDTDPNPWSQQENRKIIVADPTNTKFYKLDSTEGFSSSDMSCYLERTGLALVGRDRKGQWKVDFSRRKLVTRVWPKIEGTALVTVRVGAQEERNGVVTWQSSGVFNPQTDKYLDLTANGRLLAIRFETTGQARWKLEGYDIEIALLGAH